MSKDELSIKLKKTLRDNSRYIKDKNAFINKLLILNDNPNYAEIINSFFVEIPTPFFAGSRLFLSGDDPEVRFDFLYKALNKHTISDVPLFIMMDECFDFVSIYNANIQNRMNFSSSNFFLDVSDYVLPLFLFFYEYRNTFSFLTPELTIREGEIILSFESLEAFFSKELIKSKDIYHLFIEELSMQSKATVDSIIDKLVFKKEDNVLFISAELYKVRNRDRNDRIITYIKAKGSTSAKDIADYFGISKRTANYVLLNLIKRGDIGKTSEKNAPNTQYYVINNKRY